MRIATLNKDGIRPAMTRSVVPPTQDKSPFYCIAHGQPGLKAWEYRMPLYSPHFPYDPAVACFDLRDDNYRLVVNPERPDIRGNPKIVINRGESDSKYLILLDTEPYAGGVAYYSVTGEAKVIAKGAGCSGDSKYPTEYPVILVEGPCKIVWVRDGESKDHDYRAWDAAYDGASWSIMPHFSDWHVLLRNLNQGHKALAG